MAPMAKERAGANPAIAGAALRGEAFTAGLLRLYLFYRFFLAGALLGGFYAHFPSDVFGRHLPGLFAAAAAVYLAAAALALGFYQLQGRHLGAAQIFACLLVDVAALSALMFASGGLSSGIGYLLLVTVAVGATLFTGQTAVLLPALASLAIILEAVVGHLLLGRDLATVFPAGVLGVLLFVTALIFAGLSRALDLAERTAERQARTSAGLVELNQAILERMRTGILVVDEAGTIEQINSAARELLGRTGAARLAIGASLAEEPELAGRLAAWRRQPLARPAPFTPRLGGTELLPAFAALEGPHGRRALIFLEDLRAARQQAEQLKLASLGQLAGSIAHEVRNPLSAIGHAAELLAERCAEDAAVRRLTEIIRGQVRRLDQIVESVLALSKREPVRPQRLDLAAWLPRFVAQYRQGAPGAEIALELAEGLRPILFDPVHLERVLANLLDNGLRHSRAHAGLAWAAVRGCADAETGALFLEVADRGPGVPPEARPRLFEPFFSTEPQGAGLGLYIAAELCAANHASLTLRSEAGPGAVFRITFAHPDKIFH